MVFKLLRKPPPMISGSGASGIPNRQVKDDPGTQVPMRSREQKVTSDELRAFRELLRERYSLDIQIWELRTVHFYNQQKVIDIMKKADALLLRIKATAISMNHRSFFDKDDDWDKFRLIYEKVMAPGKRVWLQKLPFGEE